MQFAGPILELTLLIHEFPLTRAFESAIIVSS